MLEDKKDNRDLLERLKDLYGTISGAASMSAGIYDEPVTDRDNDMFDYGLHYAYSVCCDFLKEFCPEIKS